MGQIFKQSSLRVVSRQNCLPLPFRMLAKQARENGNWVITRVTLSICLSVSFAGF